MRKYTKWSLVIGAGLSLFALPPCVTRADDPASANAAAADAAKNMQFPAGFEMTNGAPSEGIRDGLAKVTERAVTKGSFDSMLAELSKPDRERAREFKNVDQAKLDAQIDKFQQLWKAKYGHEFKPDVKVAFGAPILIVQGKVTDPAVAITKWPVPADAGQVVAAAAHEARQLRPPGDNKDAAIKDQVSAEKLEKGRMVAMIRYPAMGVEPELTISMIHHLPAFWRIDIPNDRGGEQIYNDLLTHLTWLTDNSNQWPDDINLAYRTVGYHVTAALYGDNSAVGALKKG
jgi:hypothetical protein